MLAVPNEDAGPEDAALTRCIAAAAGAGDVAAEVELYRRLAPRVRLYALKHLRDSTAAWDLAQDVMMLALERLRIGGFRDAEQLVSFVAGACRITVLAWKRAGPRRERVPDPYADDLLIADEQRPRVVANCAFPTAPATLRAYWLGEVDEALEASLDEHLLGCDVCSVNLRNVVDLGDGVGAALPSDRRWASHRGPHVR